MKHAAFFCMGLFLLLSLAGTAQDTPAAIAQRLKPKGSGIVHDVIRQENLWGFKNVLIAFYETRYTDSSTNPPGQHRQYVEAFLLIPVNGSYKKIRIDKYEDDNVDTRIESVFLPMQIRTKRRNS
ncbi:hypothetical protein [Niabella beijingensis]|uniref:hypothetical protein n=1 Tax=Niabella beijingensis TaxID=2872700 RepID=UPI001CBACB8F|nr:hypothetical protein [Niabella beijingensis]MBZ4191187.1 hypothetical protein [Niabella beijingensis]